MSISWPVQRTDTHFRWVHRKKSDATSATSRTEDERDMGGGIIAHHGKITYCELYVVQVEVGVLLLNVRKIKRARWVGL